MLENRRENIADRVREIPEIHIFRLELSKPGPVFRLQRIEGQADSEKDDPKGGLPIRADDAADDLPAAFAGEMKTCSLETNAAVAFWDVSF